MAEAFEHPAPEPRRSRLGLHRLRSWFRGILRAHLGPKEAGVAVAIGVFIGVLPIYGIHLPVCVLVARRLGLNQAVVYGAANISNPFFAPFLVAAGLHLGALIHTGKAPATLELGDGALWTLIREAPGLYLECFLGSLVIGAGLGPLLGGLVAWAMLYWQGRRKEAHEGR
jgi:uncharacterized protein (DUF2062 family)